MTSYHWLGNKCSLCESYNTVLLEQIGPNQIPQAQEQEQRMQETVVGEAGLTASQNHTPTEELTEPAQPTPAPAPMPLPHPAASILARSPPNGSPWMMPHSPTRSVRSVSPVVGSYFGTGARVDRPRQGTPLADDDDEEDLDFWGGQSPRSQDDMHTGEADEDSSSDDLDIMEEDETEEEEADDVMDILGHR